MRKRCASKIKFITKGEKLRKHAALLFLIPLMLFSCKAASVKKDGPQMTVQEQEDKAMDKFRDMLEGTKELRREDTVPLITAGYGEVIDKYPDSFLAEESYYRLMVLNLRDYSPPREEEAERLYREYFQKYKDPRIGMAMNGDLARYYYDNNRWERLARFTTPFMREFLKSGKYGDTVFIFFYTEAKFFLKDYEEARKGYQIIKKNFPGTGNAKIAEHRLEYMKSIQKDK